MIVRLKSNPNYGVTEDGRVYSYRKGKFMSLVTSWGAGYPMVNLKYKGQQKLCAVHRLIAETFLDNPEGKREVNHINGDKTDNRVENLEWVTPSENIQHAYRTGLHPDNMKVAMCDGEGNILKVFNSQGETENDGFDQRLVSRAIRNGYRHHGYYWKRVI